MGKLLAPVEDYGSRGGDWRKRCGRRPKARYITS